jgi:hypothetical protein
MSFRALRGALALLCILSFQTAVTWASESGAVSSMQHKLAHIEKNGGEKNGASPQPDETPTVFTESEVNAYFASGEVELPTGVKSVRFAATPEVITGTAQINFDQLKSGHNSNNPLLSIFSGTHDVVVVAHAHGAGHKGFVHVDSVSLDGAEIPRFLLQLFVEKYLQPTYPDLGLDSQFELPNRIDTATVGEHTLTVTQK